jgi:hypothetical protein
VTTARTPGFQRRASTRALWLFSLMFFAVLTVVRPACESWAAGLPATVPDAASIAGQDIPTNETCLGKQLPDCHQLLEMSPSALQQLAATAGGDPLKLPWPAAQPQFYVVQFTPATVRNAAAYGPPPSHTPLYLRTSRLLI